MNTLKIEIWSDVMCPWCAIGHANLATALKALEGEIEAEIRWMPFELNPDLPEQGEPQDAIIARKYGRSPEQAAEMRAMIRDRGEEAGFSLAWQGEGPEPVAMMWNTNKAHRLLRWALDTAGAAAQTRLKLALFRAHFRERRNVADSAVLVEIAAAEGLDAAGAAAALTDDALAGKVAWEEDRAAEMNITGVPAMVVNGRLMIPGSQAPETYLNALRHAVSKGI